MVIIVQRVVSIGTLMTEIVMVDNIVAGIVAIFIQEKDKGV